MKGVAVLLLLAFVACVYSQDPADGWLGYAKAVYPAGKQITYVEAKWVVPDDPKVCLWRYCGSAIECSYLCSIKAHNSSPLGLVLRAAIT